MKKAKEIHEITCKRHYDGSNSKLVFETYDEHGCRIDSFDHYYKWSSPEELLTKMARTSLTVCEFEQMWKKVQDLWFLITKAKNPVVVFTKE